jgi:hypothetical protein
MSDYLAHEVVAGEMLAEASPRWLEFYQLVADVVGARPLAEISDAPVDRQTSLLFWVDLLRKTRTEAEATRDQVAAFLASVAEGGGA